MSIVRHKIYGSEQKPTIYYLTGYGSHIKQFRPHVYALMLGGFRIVIFEYDKSILNNGNPHMLLGVLKDIEKIINRDKKGREVAGLYGVSLGSWLGLHALVACKLQKAMFNTGGVSIVNTVWNNPFLKDEKAAFEKHGHNLHSLEKLWGPYDVKGNGKSFADKQVMVMNSDKDKIIDFKESKSNITSWQKDNTDVELIISRHLDHGAAIKRHMLRLRKTIRFFKNTKKQKQEVVSYPISNRRG